MNTGEIPIYKASVTVYAAGNTGYGSAPTLLTKTTTDNMGNYSIASISCPSPSSQIYLVATGGEVGNNTTANSAIVLMTPLGACGSLVFPVMTDIDELTTVASAYTLAQFINPANTSQVGTSLTNPSGLANAASLIPNLVSFVDGTASTFLSNSTNSPITLATLNTISNLLATCVESSGSTSTECTSLFADVVPPPSPNPKPSDTLGAALAIARNPASNIDELLSLQPTSNLPYVPALNTTTMYPYGGLVLGLNYAAVGANQPQGIAIDAFGNVWVANQGGSGSVSAFSPAGTLLPHFPVTSGLNTPYGIAIDPSGNAWVTNYGNDTLAEITSSGTSPSGSPFTGSLSSPKGVAIDRSGDVWVTNSGAGANTLSEFNSKGVLLGQVSGGGMNTPVAIAIDATGNIWTGNGFAGTVSEFSSAGVPISPSFGYTGGGIIFPNGIAIDSQGDAWQNNTNTVKSEGGVSKLSSSGSPISPAPYGWTSGGENGSGVGIAIDSQGNAWSTNSSSTGSSISETSSVGAALSTGIGFGYTTTTPPQLSSPQEIAVDASGNVWTTNQTSNVVTVFIGAASPVLTPLIACQLRTTPAVACLP